MTNKLLSDVEKFIADTGMGEFAFGLKAAGNSRLLERLRSKKENGHWRGVWPETEEKIRAYMASYEGERAA